MTDPSNQRKLRRPVKATVLAQILGELAPAAADQLLAQHVDDGSGHCRGCALPQAGQTRWPCTIHAIGTAMRQQARAAGRR